MDVPQKYRQARILITDIWVVAARRSCCVLSRHPRFCAHPLVVTVEPEGLPGTQTGTAITLVILHVVRVATILQVMNQSVDFPTTTLPPEIRTGIELIDREHAKLLKLEDRLASGCAKKGQCDTCPADSQNKCHETTNEMFSELLEFMCEHFMHEEGLMIGVPREMAQAHKFEHAEISGRLAELISHNVGKAMLASPWELSRLVEDWLHDHIVRWDLPLARRLVGASNN